MEKKWTIHQTIITICGMCFLSGMAYLAHLQGVDGFLLGIIILLGVGLANTDLLKLLLPYLDKTILKREHHNRK